jgi:hypothetical protein
VLISAAKRRAFAFVAAGVRALLNYFGDLVSLATYKLAYAVLAWYDPESAELASLLAESDEQEAPKQPLPRNEDGLTVFPKKADKPSEERLIETHAINVVLTDSLRELKTPVDAFGWLDACSHLDLNDKFVRQFYIDCVFKAGLALKIDIAKPLNVKQALANHSVIAPLALVQRRAHRATQTYGDFGNLAVEDPATGAVQLANLLDFCQGRPNAQTRLTPIQLVKLTWKLTRRARAQHVQTRLYGPLQQFRDQVPGFGSKLCLRILCSYLSQLAAQLALPFLPAPTIMMAMMFGAPIPVPNPAYSRFYGLMLAPLAALNVRSTRSLLVRHLVIALVMPPCLSIASWLTSWSVRIKWKVMRTLSSSDQRSTQRPLPSPMATAISGTLRRIEKWLQQPLLAGPLMSVLSYASFSLIASLGPWSCMAAIVLLAASM